MKKKVGCQKKKETIAKLNQRKRIREIDTRNPPGDSVIEKMKLRKKKEVLTKKKK